MDLQVLLWGTGDMLPRKLANLHPRLTTLTVFLVLIMVKLTGTISVLYELAKLKNLHKYCVLLLSKYVNK